MSSIGDQECVPSGSHCKVHGKRLGDDGMCAARRSYMRGMIHCVMCATEVAHKIARTLNPQLIELQQHLRRPAVEIPVMPMWLKLLKSKPGDGICPDCAGALITGVNGGAGQVPFVDGDGAVVKGIAITIPFVSDAKAIAQVAQAIVGRRKVNFAAKREDLMLTQCIVAANAPHACGTWYDWAKMPTITMPNEDGTPSRGHFGFCPWCAEVLVQQGVTLGPALKDMIRPPRHKVVVHPATGTLCDVDRTPCNACEAVRGDPSERLEFVPLFDAAALHTPDDCVRALGETSERYRWLMELHELEEAVDAEEAKSRAKTCLLHGPEFNRLGTFRYRVIERIKERWPEQWRQRKHGVEADTLARRRKREKNAATRLEREHKRTERSARDRANAPVSNQQKKARR